MTIKAIKDILFILKIVLSIYWMKLLIKINRIRIRIVRFQNAKLKKELVKNESLLKDKRTVGII